MAFFKFRFPGQAEQTAVSADAVPVGAAENIDVVRRRARHRLIGAVVLVLGAVIVFPVLFDSQPRPVATNTPILIPDRQSTQTPPLAPPPSLPTNAGLDAGEQVVAAAAVPAAPPATSALSAPAQAAPAAEPPVASAAPSAPDLPAAQPAPKPASATVPLPADKSAPVKPPKSEPPNKPEPTVKPKDDGSKAKSLLEGKPVSPTGRHVIQVGAFSDVAKVREVRQKLQQAGVTTYTQVIEGKDGKNTTRVRVGPFDSREEAEKVAARVRKLGLSPALLKL